MKGPARKRNRTGRQAVRHAPQTPPPRRGRPWTLAVLLLVLVFTGGGILWWLQGWRLQDLQGLQSIAEFPLRQVRVAGSFRHVNAPQVRDIVAPYAAQGFFATDVAAIRSALRALPWVEQVAVRRVWPDYLQITVTEQKAVARWGRDGLVNARGEVFTPLSGALQEDLPQLEGPPGSAPQMLTRCRDMEGTLAPLGLKVVGLSLDRRRSWRALLDNGVQLALGKEQPVQRVARFVRYYPGVAAGRKLDAEVFDLRYANGFVVRWRPAGATMKDKLPS